jgi:hypothetical protein
MYLQLHSAQFLPFWARFFRHDNIAQMTHDCQSLTPVCKALTCKLQGAYMQTARRLHAKMYAAGYQVKV